MRRGPFATWTTIYSSCRQRSRTKYHENCRKKSSSIGNLTWSKLTNEKSQAIQRQTSLEELEHSCSETPLHSPQQSLQTGIFQR